MKYLKPIHDFYLINFNLILPFIFYCIFSLYLIVLSFLYFQLLKRFIFLLLLNKIYLKTLNFYCFFLYIFIP